MIVCDASVYVDALVGDAATGGAARRRLRTIARIAVPSMFPAEVTSALRSLELRGEITTRRADRARSKLAVTRAHLFAFAPLSDRVWDLRHNLAVHDAWYAALAERLDTVLITADERLANAAGPRCDIEQVVGA